MKTLLSLTAVLAMAAAMPALAATDKDMDAKMDMKFEKMDTNKDGAISQQEHDAFSKKMFTEADTNNDSKLSRDELHAQKMKEKDKPMSSRGDSRDFSRDTTREMNPSAGAAGGSDTDKTTTGADNVEYPKGLATSGDATRNPSGAATDRSKY
jgi:hypothetical protein